MQSTVKYAVICAAGMGTRLGLDIPKCLVEIGGRRIIDYMLDLLTPIQNIYIVVGFMEDKVIERVHNIRQDIVFVRNPEYMTTSNAHSLWLGSRNIQEPYLMLDGDMLIEPKSFQNFLASYSGSGTLIGISDAKTEEAVFVSLNDTGTTVNAFSRKPISQFEWCGISIIDNIPIEPYSKNYIYEILEKHLPLNTKSINCFEVDTPNDLDYTIKNYKND
jgi:choline kinase